jgi:hypothetical protein
MKDIILQKFSNKHSNYTLQRRPELFLYWQASTCPSLGMIHITVLALRPLLNSMPIPFLDKNDHPNHKIN